MQLITSRIGYGFVVRVMSFLAYRISLPSRNSILAKPPKKALRNIMKGSSWVTKSVSSFHMAAEGPQNIATNLALASNVANLAIGLGKTSSFLDQLTCVDDLLSRSECPNSTNGYVV